MKNLIKTTFLLLALTSGAAGAAGFDGSKPLLCASNTVIECVPVHGCKQVPPEAIAAPAFLRVDFARNMLLNAGGGESEKLSLIKRSEKVDGKLILQGAEDGIQDVRDGLGWTMAIAMDSGKMVLTASGDAAAFTIFGACTTL